MKMRSKLIFSFLMTTSVGVFLNSGVGFSSDEIFEEDMNTLNMLLDEMEEESHTLALRYSKVIDKMVKLSSRGLSPENAKKLQKITLMKNKAIVMKHKVSAYKEIKSEFENQTKCLVSIYNPLQGSISEVEVNGENIPCNVFVSTFQLERSQSLDRINRLTMEAEASFAMAGGEVDNLRRDLDKATDIFDFYVNEK